jgi:hypothetical protein
LFRSNEGAFTFITQEKNQNGAEENTEDNTREQNFSNIENINLFQMSGEEVTSMT